MQLCSICVANAGPGRVPIDPNGHPDLSGDWTSLSATDFERPERFHHLVLTEEQAAAYERIQNDADLMDQYFKAEREKKGEPEPPDVGGLHTGFLEHVRMMRIDGRARSSIITDPSDGQIPYSDAGNTVKKAALWREKHDFSNPESRPVEERCILGAGEPLGPPLAPETASATYTIAQTQDTVAIESEMNHDVRTIRLNARHGPSQIRPWMGDSIGRWEGRALRVETTNFNPGEGYTYTSGGSIILSDTAKVVEWFTRISATEISYRFRVADPKTYKKPWAGEMVLKASPVSIIEFACHEGNYSLEGILAGARHQEAVAKAANVAAPPQPSGAFTYFDGTWRCDGIFPSTGKTISSTMSFHWNASTGALVKQHDDLPPHNYHAVELWTVSAKGSLQNLIADAFGGVRLFSSSDWNGKTLTWGRDADESHQEQFVYTRLDADRMQVDWATSERGGTFVVGDTLTCLRVRRAFDP
jgi:hypothetical protein